MKTGYIDVVEGQYIKGWAYSKDDSGIFSTLSISIDERVVDTVTCREDRVDVFEAGHHRKEVGFSYNIPERYFDGMLHRLRVHFLDKTPVPFVRDGRLLEELAFCVRSSVEVEYEGWIDQVKGDSISGWVLKRFVGSDAYINQIQVGVFCDDTLIGQVVAEDYRPDVGEAFKTDPSCGFRFTIPTNYLLGHKDFVVKTIPDGWTLNGSPVSVSRSMGLQETRISYLQAEIAHALTLLWKASNELSAMKLRDSTSVSHYNSWARNYFEQVSRKYRGRTEVSRRVLVSVLCPVHEPRAKDLVSAIQSVVDQTYTHWELIIVGDRGRSAEITAIIQQFCAAEARIRFVECDADQGPSAATNKAIEASLGEYIAFFDPEDLLVDVALEAMVFNATEFGASILYSDEDRIDDLGNFSEPNLKPDWNLRLLLSQNYVCRLWVVARTLIERTGPFRSEYDGAHEHDFLLRLGELEDEPVRHVREILYHRRKPSDATGPAPSGTPSARDAGASAVQACLDRNSSTARVSPQGTTPNYVVDWVLAAEPSVSVIIPFKDNALNTRRCVDAFIQTVQYRNYELVLVNNDSVEADTYGMIAEILSFGLSNVRLMDVKGPFNYSKINNIAAESCESDLVLFLNNDVFVDDPTFLTQLVGEMHWRNDVGAVGCKLLYPSRRVQHAGVIIGIGDGRIAEHPYRGLSETDPGFMGRAVCSQELSAVTAAALLCKRKVFDDVGRFDEAKLPVAYNDVDLCLRIREAGYRVVWRAETIAIHQESASRSSDMHDSKIGRFVSEHIAMQDRWKNLLSEDPFYHPFFDRNAVPFQSLRNDVMD